MNAAERKALDEAQAAYLQLLLDAGCKIQFRTVLFGKEYVWMTDRAGTTFLERLPDLEPTTVSVDGQTGEVTPVR